MIKYLHTSENWCRSLRALTLYPQRRCASSRKMVQVYASRAKALEVSEQSCAHWRKASWKSGMSKAYHGDVMLCR